MKPIDWNENWHFRAENCPEVGVTLPHDAMQHSGRRAAAPSGDGGAYYLGERCTYEKTFSLTEDEAAGTVLVHFDGVYGKAAVWLNDQKVAENCYGYLPFFADLSGLAAAGENLLWVEVDNTRQPNSRWYSGTGIYRSVQLWLGGKSYILPEGVRVKTLGIAPATLEVSVAHTGGEVEIEVLDGECCVASAAGDHAVLTVPDAKLWSDETPHLYRCRARLYENGVLADTAERPFGIRTLRYDTTGLYVNGRRTMLRGGCIHHDNGILGACSLPEAETRRLRALKAAGFNAIRSSHNPASADLLDACDRLGVYVMDEMWDMWYQRKNKFDYGADFAAHWKDDVAAVVQHDYNHPSVILYSIGNENTEPFEAEGVTQAKEITARFHALDDSRPTTIGMNMALIAMSAMGMGLFDHVDDAPVKQPAHINSTAYNEMASQSNNLLMATVRPEVNALCTPVMQAVDIVGYNYAAPRYPLDAKEHPDQVSVGSETYCYQLAETWQTLAQCPYVIGDFMWTAVDYIGEVGIGAWAHTKDALEFKKPYPWKLADVGAFDLLLDPTGEALLAKAVWQGETSLAVRPVPYPWQELARGGWRGTNAIPSWSWRGCEGQNATVEVYTPGVRAELYLNGALAGSGEVKNKQVIFDLPYQPGRLEAVAYDADGKICGQAALATATGRLSWKIGCEADAIQNGDVVYFPIALRGENGEVESNADCELTLAVTGGELLGFGSAEPRTEAEFLTGTYPSYHGRALAAVRVRDAEALRLTLRAAGTARKAGEALCGTAVWTPGKEH